MTDAERVGRANELLGEVSATLAPVSISALTLGDALMLKALADQAWSLSVRLTAALEVSAIGSASGGYLR